MKITSISVAFAALALVLAIPQLAAAKPSMAIAAAKPSSDSSDSSVASVVAPTANAAGSTITKITPSIPSGSASAGTVMQMGSPIGTSAPVVAPSASSSVTDSMHSFNADPTSTASFSLPHAAVANAASAGSASGGSAPDGSASVDSDSMHSFTAASAPVASFSLPNASSTNTAAADASSATPASADASDNSGKQHKDKTTDYKIDTTGNGKGKEVKTVSYDANGDKVVTVTKDFKDGVVKSDTRTIDKQKAADGTVTKDITRVNDLTGNTRTTDETISKNADGSKSVAGTVTNNNGKVMQLDGTITKSDGVRTYDRTLTKANGKVETKDTQVLKEGDTKVRTTTGTDFKGNQIDHTELLKKIHHDKNDQPKNDQQS